MSDSPPGVVEEFPVHRLAKDESFGDLCRSFVEAAAVSICLLDDRGDIIVDIRHPNDPSYEMESNDAERVRYFAETSDIIRRTSFTHHQEMHSIRCQSGLIYWVRPIVFGGETLGRSVLGPLHEASEYRVLKRPIAFGQLIKPTSDDTHDPGSFEAAARSVFDNWQRVLDSFLSLFFRLHLTSQMHIATMDAAYNELKERNSELEDSNRKLAELDQSKSNFVATISHELKTPLTSIIGYAEMLVEGLVGPIAPEQHRPLNTILEKGEHLLELIEQLLDLAKSDVRESPVHRASISIADWVDRSLSDVRPQAERKRIRLFHELDPAVPIWHGDVRRLRRVLTNLLSNAVKFTPEDGAVTVRVKAELNDTNDLFALTGDPELVLEVEDTGIGIARGDRERIFDAFVQVDNSATREVGGTGLGLVIVKKFVEEHEGTVSIDSELGKGTRIRCRFPASTRQEKVVGEL